MRVLIVSAMFPPVQTGTSFYTKNLAASLHKNGHKVTVVTVKRKTVSEEKYPFKVIRINALTFPIANYFKHFSISSIFPRNYHAISEICKKEKVEKIILVNQYLDIVFPTINAAVKNKIPLHLSIGTQLQSLNPVRNKILHALDRIICGNFVYPFSHKIICWDKEIERYVNEVQQNKFSDKTHIIPFGVNGDIKRYTNCRHSYKLHNQVLGVGSVIGHRNCIFNIKVFKKLLEKNPNLRLKIIGHIYDKRAVNLVDELKLNKYVTFTGERNHDEVLREYQYSDIHWMMLDGEYKGLGTANLEAMLMGLPVVSNAPKDLFGKDKLKDMKNCILIDDKSINTAVKKINSVLNDVNLRKKIGLGGKRFCQDYMSWDYVAKEFEKI